jgi:hypothetical protein
MLSTSTLAVFLGLCASRASAWVIGKEQTETHPKMTWQRCTGRGGSSCTNVNGEIVIDANWRWLHSVGGYTNCFDGNEWNTTACPNNAACTRNCAIEGSDYRGTYGITTSGNALTLKFITKGQYSTNIGSRTYLMKDANNYEVRDCGKYRINTNTDHSCLRSRCLTLSEMNSPSMSTTQHSHAVSTEPCISFPCPRRVTEHPVRSMELVGHCVCAVRRA